MPYTGESESVTEGSQGKIQGRNKSRAETGTGALEEFCLLTCTPELTQFALFIQPKTTCLGMAPSAVECALRPQYKN